jgi:hypothetical protein
LTPVPGSSENVLVAQQETTGVLFARALAAKDSGRLRELMHPAIEFRAMTPRRNWEANDPDAVIGVLFGHWFEDSDEIRGVEQIESDSFADRERVGYRFSVNNEEGDHLVDQQAYLSEREGQISWMRVLCSGYRPVPPADQ